MGLWNSVNHDHADNNGVKIHYVTAGDGPLMVMVHGFPDYWYTWRNQIPPLAKHFQIVAIDQRGFNKSDKPKGIENYKMSKLVSEDRAISGHHDDLVYVRERVGAIDQHAGILGSQRRPHRVLGNLSEIVPGARI